MNKQDLIFADIRKLNETGPLRNNEIIALLGVIGWNFDPIASVTELASLPVGSYVFGKDFQILHAHSPEVTGNPDNDEEVFKECSPLYLLCIP